MSRTLAIALTALLASCDLGTPLAARAQAAPPQPQICFAVQEQAQILQFEAGLKWADANPVIQLFAAKAQAAQAEAGKPKVQNSPPAKQSAPTAKAP